MHRYILTFAALLSFPAFAHDVPDGQQHWPDEITSIYWSDGDSGWINGKKNGYPFRLNDVDAGETTKGHWVTYKSGRKKWRGAKCEEERALGFEAKAWAVELTARKLSSLKITGYHGHDGNNRHIVDLWYVRNTHLGPIGRNLAQAGLKAGHYKSWKHDGSRELEPRPLWCG